MSKTREEVEFLKRNWVNDPCYDLDEVEGFEEYKAELYLYRVEMELKWTERALKDLRERIGKYQNAHRELMEAFDPFPPTD